MDTDAYQSYSLPWLGGHLKLSLRQRETHTTVRTIEKDRGSRVQTRLVERADVSMLALFLVWLGVFAVGGGKYLTTNGVPCLDGPEDDIRSGSLLINKGVLHVSKNLELSTRVLKGIEYIIQ